MRLEAELQPLAADLDSALADGLERLVGARAWSSFELDASFDDLLKLSERQDACYDRPSTGWAYAAWYHGRRTHIATRLLADALLGEGGSLTVVDLGAGTGATAWALTSIVAAASKAGRPLPRISLVGVDSSEPMLDAAECLWGQLRRSALGSFAAEISVDFQLASWTDLARLELPGSDRGWVVGSYLFDHSDSELAPALGALFQRSVRAVDAHEVLFTGGASKARVARAVMTSMTEHGWAEADVRPLPALWNGPLNLVHAHRQRVFGTTDRARRWPASPTWQSSQEQPRFHRLRFDGPTQLFAPEPASALVLDEDQEEAATPDDRLTVIVGAAGSGKSMVLVERVAKTVEQWPAAQGPLRALVTTFNKRMMAQLHYWLGPRLQQTGRAWSSTGTDGAYKHKDGRGSEIILLNIDKLPTREFGVERANGHRLLPTFVDRWLANRPGPRLTDAQRKVLQPAFLEAEMKRVIYGLGVWGSLQEYLDLEVRIGRGIQISQQQKELIWGVMMESGLRTFTHCRIDALERARELEKPPYTHLFVDECQDATPADFELLSRLVPDPNRLVAAGDEAQAMHLGGSYRRAGRMDLFEAYHPPGGPAFRLWNAWPLEGSYRLPVRVCECVESLAKAIEDDRNQRGVEHDVSVPRAKKAAVLGVRPIVLAASNWEEGLGEVFDTFGRLLAAVPERSRIVSVAEDSLPVARVEQLAPPGIPACRESMLEIKGLERACILWATGQPFDSDESELEWVFTILTRSVGLAVLVVDPARTPKATRNAVRLLRRDRLLCWDEAATQALERTLAP